MNQTINTILKRRSIRSYLPRQIDDEQLNLILEAGLYASNGGNHQYTRFIVIQSPTVLEQLNTIIKEEFASRQLIDGVYQNKTILKARQEGYNFMYHAPTLISAVSLREHGNSMADCANALENMQLAATSLGLGACWVNQPHWLTDFTLIRNVFISLGMKENEDIFGSVAVGYPACPWPKPTPRKEGRVIIFAEP